MPTFYCNYYFCLELGGPLHSGAPWTLPTLPTHCYATLTLPYLTFEVDAARGSIQRSGHQVGPLRVLVKPKAIESPRSFSKLQE